MSLPATTRRLGVIAAFAASAALLVGCTSGSSAGTPTGAAASTVTIVDNHGSMDVPVKPGRVVALDNTAFETLSEWGVKPVAVPKPLMYDLWPTLSGGDSVLDVGSHREPDLEAVIAADPDVILGGYRFGSYYDDLKAIQPTIVELSPRDGKDHLAELKRQTTALGAIFDRVSDAKALNEALDAAVTGAKTAYNGRDTVVGLITSGGSISFAAPGTGRGVGVLFPTLGLTPAIDKPAEDAQHGDDISVEAIAAANPEWIVVLDRDATFGESGYVPAKELIQQSEALKNVSAVQKGRIVYLDPGFYLDEGIQAYTKLYTDVASAFAAAK